MKKIKYLLLACAVAVCLAGCSDATEEITSEDAGNGEIVEETDSEETVDSEDVVSEEESTEEESVEEVIYDVFPVGPAEANFSKDNMGFYMQGVEFTLPMAYSDFLAKVTELGWSINEDACRDVNGSTFMMYKMEFIRPVEGQEDTDRFEIQVINSVDPTQTVDLSSPDIQVISINLGLYGGSKELGNPDAGRYTVNFDTEFYLTPEIGLGRNIRNVYTTWGGSFPEFYGDWYWTTGIRQQMGLASNTAPYIDISSKSAHDDYSLYATIVDVFGEDCECEDVITWISMYNNPFVQAE